jgi:hypothetical protein
MSQGLVLADGDCVAIHGRYLGWGPQAHGGCRYLPYANGKIAAHWDVMQDGAPAAQSANGSSMLTSAQA